MFAKPFKTAEQRLLVRVLTRDAALGGRLQAALEQTGRFQVELVPGRLAEMVAKFDPAAMASLLIVEIDPQKSDDLVALEGVLRGPQAPSATVVVSDGLAESAARCLLKLQIADWLPKSCTGGEIVAACEGALRPPANPVGHARFTTFVSALGGAGATTLSIAAASAQARSSRSDLAGCCVIDLNLQSGALADYLDLTPNLQLSEIAAAPDRLDHHLLEVMLSRHASGLAILAAPPSLAPPGAEAIRADLIGRLLDLMSTRFQHVVVDAPRVWLPLFENILRGSDSLYIVTQLTVAGLRQARQLADMLEQSSGVSTKGAVIVNKVRWLGGGVSKGHAREALGDRLAGFISDDSGVILEAQNRGLLPSQVKKRNRIEAELEQILPAAQCATRLAAE
jgi:pilus assembly protein CpaE